jgi:hypothetical protein
LTGLVGKVAGPLRRPSRAEQLAAPPRPHLHAVAQGVQLVVHASERVRLGGQRMTGRQGGQLAQGGPDGLVGGAPLVPRPGQGAPDLIEPAGGVVDEPHRVRHRPR